MIDLNEELSSGHEGAERHDQEGALRKVKAIRNALIPMVGYELGVFNYCTL